ncbi:Exosome complex protein [Lachnellula subtilissima]|uniref:Exosome complex protein n=1 Tax=Lachnellula subtilissima TaxID=602034 RepID=A0A8H8RRP6_9HELO|nr:Exosome complex protein [Lachnellula subtilissima]
MDSSKVLSLLDQLDDEVDDLEEALAPLLKAALAETSSKLPLLDKAKLYTLVTYAIESLLFSYLRLHGIKAREHPVFTELTRVKQYFDKIKMTETPSSTTRTVTIDKAVARRFLEPDLAASKKDALLAAELKAKEKVRAHIKFDELNKQIEGRQNAKKRKSDGVEGKNEEGEDAEESSDSDSDSSAESVNQAPVPRKSRSRKKRKVGKGQDSLTADDGSTSTGKPKKKETKKEKKKTKEKRTKKDKGE